MCVTFQVYHYFARLGLQSTVISLCNVCVCLSGRITENRVAILHQFLGQLVRDDLINPVKMSVRPYVVVIRYVPPVIRSRMTSCFHTMRPKG